MAHRQGMLQATTSLHHTPPSQVQCSTVHLQTPTFVASPPLPSPVQYRDQILEKIRCTVEACDSLQSFLLLHSLGGGTGSGLGTYILELLAVGWGVGEGRGGGVDECVGTYILEMLVVSGGGGVDESVDMNILELLAV